MVNKKFGPQINIWRERRKFYNCKQEEGKSVSNFYSKHRNLSINCEFKNDLTNVLNDKFISGLKRGPILDRLCEEGMDKTLEELMNLARQREEHEGKAKVNEVNYLNKNSNWARRKPNHGVGGSRKDGDSNLTYQQDFEHGGPMSRRAFQKGAHQQGIKVAEFAAPFMYNHVNTGSTSATVVEGRDI